MVVLIILTMLILAHCSDINQDVTYHDVLMSMCGRRAQKLAAVSIMCTSYGVCVAIFIIIGDQLDTSKFIKNMQKFNREGCYLIRI